MSKGLNVFYSRVCWYVNGAEKIVFTKWFIIIAMMNVSDGRYYRRSRSGPCSGRFDQ